MNSVSIPKSFREVAAALDADGFQFVSKGKVQHRLRVISMSGEERVNDCYSFSVEALAPNDLDPIGTLEEELLGHPGDLVMVGDTTTPRAVHGIITGYEVVAHVDHLKATRIRLLLAPKFSLLRIRTHSRIFQEKTTPEIVAAILTEWNVTHRFELLASYTPRTYSTQYEETDYDYLRRIMAREGIFFYFRQTFDEDHEELVITDQAAYAPYPGGFGRLTMRGGNFEIGEGEILDVAVRRSLRPTAARVSNFDYRHPKLPLRDLKLIQDPVGVVNELGSERFNSYVHMHEAEHEASQSAQRRDADTQRILESLRQDTFVIQGSGRTRGLLPGHSFSLEGHPLATLNREWVVTSVRHEGTVPEFLDPNSAKQVYVNTFEAAPIEVALRMPPDAWRRFVHSSETASVVGAGDGEIHTDVSGRIKVQFHWDLEGQSDEHSSCWIRVSHPWAGAGFGFQFLPRAGTEVLIAFLNGDPDRPMIVGSVYNGTNPTPFGLPNSRTRGGIKTMSTPGGGGSNELSFEDKKGDEQILVRAERNFDTEVGKDQSVTVSGNQTTRVDGHKTATVVGTVTNTVVGGLTTLVTLHKTTQVTGDVLDAVKGNADRRISGEDNLRVEGTARQDLAASEVLVRTDAVTRVRGHMVSIVGEENARTSATTHVQGQSATYSTGVSEIVSETEVVIRCGKSTLRIGPERVEIQSPSIMMTGKEFEVGADESVTMLAKKDILIKSMERVNLNGKTSSLFLFKDADLGGDKVKLNCVMDEDAVIASQKPLTRIVLQDEEGKPARNRRFVVVTPAGERSGLLNDKGEAEVEVNGPAQIYFPDVDRPRKA